jgi:hypothetical protein
MRIKFYCFYNQSTGSVGADQVECKYLAGERGAEAGPKKKGKTGFCDLLSARLGPFGLTKNMHGRVSRYHE